MVIVLQKKKNAVGVHREKVAKQRRNELEAGAGEEEEEKSFRCLQKACYGSCWFEPFPLRGDG